MTVDGAREAIARVPRWRHSIEVAPGVVTPGGPTHRVLRRIGLPADLTGKSVLDIGCSDGFFAFECERRGASRVVAIDDWSSPFVDTPEGFRTARDLLGSNVEYRSLDLQTLDAAELGQFDLVLCLGVLYHLRHPLLGLEQLSRLTTGLLILETEVSESLINRPYMTFARGLFRGRDITTWWVPSISCVHDMALAAGFQRVETTKVFDTRAVFQCHKDHELLLRQIAAFGAADLAYALDGSSANSEATLRGMPLEELWRVHERLVWSRSSRIAQKGRFVSAPYGAYRRLLSGLLDVLRALKLRYR